MGVTHLDLRASPVTPEVGPDERHDPIAGGQELVVADLGLLGPHQHQVEQAAEGLLAAVGPIAREIRVVDLAVVVVIREHTFDPLVIEGLQHPPADLEVALQCHP